MFILFIVVMLAPWDWLAVLVWLWIQVYLYLAMKRVYGQGWLKTWLKHILLLGSYNVVLLAVLVGVLGGSLWLASRAADHPWWLGWLG